MKTPVNILLYGLLALASSPIMAEAPAPAPAPMQSAAKHYTTQETTLGTLLGDTAAKAIVDKHIPGLSDNPQIGMASGMTLDQISQMAPDQIKKETLAAIDVDLAKLPAK